MDGPPDQNDPLVFRNPVIPGFNPDPTVCVVPATDSAPTTYFLSTSTFEFFPGCATYASSDLLNWKLIGHALNRRRQLGKHAAVPSRGEAVVSRERAVPEIPTVYRCMPPLWPPVSFCAHRNTVADIFACRNVSSLVVSTSTRTTSGTTMHGLTQSSLTIRALTKTCVYETSPT